MNPFMFMLRRLVFGLLYTLGIDMIKRPRKYKKAAQKARDGAKSIGQNTVLIAAGLIALVYFWQLLTAALVLAIIGTIVTWVFTVGEKRKDEGEDKNNDRPS